MEEPKVWVSPFPDGENLVLTNTGIRLAGRFTQGPGQVSEKADPDAALFLFCEDGQGFVEIDGRVALIGAGDCALLFPGEAQLFGASAEVPFSVQWISFSGEILDFMKGQMELREGGVVLRRLPADFRPVLGGIFGLLSGGQDLLRQMEAGSLLTAMLCRLMQSYTAGGVTQRHAARAREYLLAHIEEDTSLEDLSAAVGVSRFHLIRLFKSHFGSSPMEYLRSLRMQRACDLLLGTHLSVREIGRQLSYQSAYHFSQSFKQYTGWTPGAFRRLAIKKKTGTAKPQGAAPSA